MNIHPQKIKDIFWIWVPIFFFVFNNYLSLLKMDASVYLSPQIKCRVFLFFSYVSFFADSVVINDKNPLCVPTIVCGAVASAHAQPPSPSKPHAPLDLAPRLSRAHRSSSPPDNPREPPVSVSFGGGVAGGNVMARRDSTLRVRREKPRAATRAALPSG